MIPNPSICPPTGGFQLTSAINLIRCKSAINHPHSKIDASTLCTIHRHLEGVRVIYNGPSYKPPPPPSPVWKICIVRSFDVPYIFYSKFSKSRACNLQTFQSGAPSNDAVNKARGLQDHLCTGPPNFLEHSCVCSFNICS